METIDVRVRLSILDFELIDASLVAAALPGETAWRARMVLEGVETGDGRMIEPNALDWRDLPLTLSLQETTPSGMNPHGDADAAGRIETLERVPFESVEGAFAIDGTGVFTADEPGERAALAVGSQKLRGISVDLDMYEVRFEAEIDPTTGEILREVEIATNGRIMGAIITANAAFAETTIQLDEGVPEVEVDEDVELPEVEVDPIAAAAGGGLVSSDFFGDLTLDRLTPFTLEPIPGVDGIFEVFGHIAPRDLCHLGLPGCRTVPLSSVDYGYFHTKAFEASDRKVWVGCLTLRGLHTDLKRLADSSEFELQRSFEDMDTVAAWIRAGHDQFGVWVHGVTRLGLTPVDVELLRGSNPSGEWKPIRGNNELVRVHNVPVPAFPVLVASALFRDGVQVAFALSGPLPEVDCPEVDDEADRLFETLVSADVSIENGQLEAFAASAFSAALAPLVERLDRIERTQSAMVKFRDGIPEKL